MDSFIYLLFFPDSELFHLSGSFEVIAKLPAHCILSYQGNRAFVAAIPQHCTKSPTTNGYELNSNTKSEH